MKKLLSIILLCTSILACDTENKSSNYEIKSKVENKKASKISIKIVLDKEYSKIELETVATEIKKDHIDFSEIVIFCYLPEMNIEKAAWATCKYNPELNIEIAGALKEQKDKILATPLPDGKIIGKWYDNRAYVESFIILFQKDNKYFERKGFKDGSYGDNEISLKNDKYFTSIESNEYYQIQENGDLGQYSSNGLFATAKKQE